MMNDINKKDQDPQARKLGDLLRSVTPRTRPEHEWIALENELMARLDAQDRKRSWSPIERISGLFSANFHPIPAFAGLAVLIVAAIVVYLGSTVHAPALAGSGLLSQKGSVCIRDESGRQSFSPASLRKALLRKGQIFETGSASGAIMRIDAGSAFKLAENSRLVVKQADQRHFVLLIDRGSILLSVSKRTPDQVFAVMSPNSRCTVVGTVFSISVDRSEPAAVRTLLSVYEGKVEMRPTGTEKSVALVPAGQLAAVSGASLSGPRPIGEIADAVRDISLLKLSLDAASDSSQKFGILECVSSPAGAVVSINDQAIGRTPMLIRKPAGDYKLAVSLDGYQTWTNHVVVRSIIDDTAESHFCNIPLARHNAAQISEPAGNAYASVSNNPDFIEALIQMTVGEYRKSLKILDSLRNVRQFTPRDQAIVDRKSVECYRGLGDFQQALAAVKKNHDDAGTHAGSSLLWEMANLKANCIGDYEGAAQDLMAYIKTYPDGPWIHDAYQRRAEVLYLTKDVKEAVRCLHEHVRRFPNDPEIDRSLYYLAYLTGHELHDCAAAAVWYLRIVDLPGSGYRENSLYELAECYGRLGKIHEAQETCERYLKRYPNGAWKSACVSRLAAIKP
jgi:tetratricopeptide (TPR) repeat protein